VIDYSGSAFYANMLMINSYQVNECFLGATDTVWSAVRYWGRASAIRRSSETALACDGQGRNVNGYGIVSFYNLQTDTTLSDVSPTTPSTLGDSMRGNGLQTNSSLWRGGYATQFDPTRHKNKMNVLFIDGHVQLVPMYKNPAIYQIASNNFLPSTLLPTADTDRIFVDPPVR
jgi:prepilin-type processing-associated H-X9-DG protein